MRVAIQKSIGGFSEYWVEYCLENDFPFKLVDVYSNDIIPQLHDCTAFMWHFHHTEPRDYLFAKQLIFSIEHLGLKVFPDFKTAWHFDDKIGQKYLIESTGLPMVPTYIFYTKGDAINWLQQVVFPKVFKLRNGASSTNVSKVRTKNEAIKLVNRAFGKGFKQSNNWINLKERIRKYRIGQEGLLFVFKGLARFVVSTRFSKVAGRELGYAYFQDFIPENDSDYRVIVIEKKAFAIKRMVRNGDFRASGSGHILYARELFDTSLISLSFDCAKKLESKCVAFDFIYDKGEPLIVEISYGFSPNGYKKCPGFWDENLNWFEGEFNPYGWMVETIL